ncbi:MAG: hypothetical protein ACRD4W_11500, partial [Nitrososphaeraceae archaeon]
MYCLASAILCLLLLSSLFLPSININNNSVIAAAKYISDYDEYRSSPEANSNRNSNLNFLSPNESNTDGAAANYVSSTETWSAYQSLGGVIRSNSDAEVVRNSDGRLEVFVVLADNQLYHKWQTSPGSNTWSAYQTLGGIIKDNTDPA